MVLTVVLGVILEVDIDQFYVLDQCMHLFLKLSVLLLRFKF